MDSALRPFAFKRAAAVGLYIPDAQGKGEFGQLVSDFKYQCKRGPDLAEALDSVLKDRFPDVRFDVLVPIPPESANRRKASLVLALTLGARRGLSTVEALTLSPNYHSDKDASKEDKFNATRDQFNVHNEGAIVRKRVLLIDDVMTTGGHAHWASKALLQKGVGGVSVAVLGRNFNRASLKALGYDGNY